MMKVSLALLFLTIGGFSQSSYSYNQGVCDAGWIQYGNACYMKFDTSVTWPEAEATCVNYVSHLASIHSSDESNFVFELMGRPTSPYTGESYWVGTHDTFQEGFYMNSDGTRVTYLPFGVGQPDNLGGEHYIGSWIEENGIITYNDYPLDVYKYPFVCKYYLSNRMCMNDAFPYGS